MNDEGEFQKARIYSFTQKDYNGPKKDLQDEAYFKIKELTRSDFPDRKLLFVDRTKEVHPFDIDVLLTFWQGLKRY